MSKKTTKKEQVTEAVKTPAQEAKEVKKTPTPSQGEEKPVELTELAKCVLSQNADRETVYIGANGGIFFDSPMIKGLKGLKELKNPFYKG